MAIIPTIPLYRVCIFFFVVHLLSCVWLFLTPWTAVCQASLFFTVSWRWLLKLMSTKLVMASNHLILCCPLLLLPSFFPSSGSFPVSQFSASGGQSLGTSASASVLPMNIQDWYWIDWLGLLAVHGTLKSLLQHHNLKASILQRSAFFMIQLLHPYMTNVKNFALPIWTSVGRVMSVLFNMLSRFVIAFLPRRKCLFIS